jgi:hypothetical protein
MACLLADASLSLAGFVASRMEGVLSSLTELAASQLIPGSADVTVDTPRLGRLEGPSPLSRVEKHNSPSLDSLLACLYVPFILPDFVFRLIPERVCS